MQLQDQRTLLSAIADKTQSANGKFNKTGRQCQGIKEASTHFKGLKTVLQLTFKWEDVW